MTNGLSVLMKGVADRFREMVTGSPDGAPTWVKRLEDGEGPGIFGPESNVWIVHSSLPTLVGGIRALILQTAHPAALTGVLEHSRYETDFVGRLIGTSKWLAITSFGTEEHIANEARRVNEMHTRVTGEYETRDGQVKRYEARNPLYLEWVHCAFTESFLICHERLAGKNKVVDSDLYVEEWQKSAIPLGLDHAPRNRRELIARIDKYVEAELVCTTDTEKVLKFVIRPPMGMVAYLFYRPLLNCAIATLRPNERELLKLKKRSTLWIPLVKFQLALLQVGLGSRPPAMEAALRRIARREKSI